MIAAGLRSWGDLPRASEAGVQAIEATEEGHQWEDHEASQSQEEAERRKEVARSLAAVVLLRAGQASSLAEEAFLQGEGDLQRAQKARSWDAALHTRSVMARSVHATSSHW